MSTDSQNCPCCGPACCEHRLVVRRALLSLACDLVPAALAILKWWISTH